MKETEVYRALASADRQHLLYVLVRRDGTATEEELSRQIAARRHHISPEQIGEEKIERAHVRLVHVHLPLLLELNVVEHNDDTVALSDEEQRDQLLEAAEVLEEWPPDDVLRHIPS